MNFKNLRKLAVFFIAALIVLAPMADAAVVTSNPAQVSLTMTVSESITVSTSVSSVNFTYQQATNNSTVQSFTLTETANLASGHTGLYGYAWLSSTTAALAGATGSTPIPSSDVFLSDNSNPAVPCSSSTIFPVGASVGQVPGALCGANVGLQMATPAAGLNTLTADPITVQLQNLPALVPTTYSGILNFAVEAF